VVYVSIYHYECYVCIVCPSLTDPNNGTINCSLGDDGVLSFEDTCSFTCNTGYELTGSGTRTCQNDGSWNGNKTMCSRGKHCIVVCGSVVLMLYQQCLPHCAIYAPSFVLLSCKQTRIYIGGS